MIETQILAYRIPRDALIGDVAVHAQNFALNEPAVVDRIGLGWKPVHHTLTVLDERELLVTFMLTREPVSAPDTVPDDLLAQ